jgi:NAD(P)H-flavin reductase
LVTEPLNDFLHQNESAKLHLYLCGSPGMIQNSKAVAAQNGVLSENIFHDAFT